MNSVIQGHIVDRIKQAGIADKGTSIYVEYIFEGNDTATVIWPYHKLAKTVTRLMHLGGKAAEERASLSPRAGKPGDIDISAPLETTSLSVATVIGQKQILLRVETKEKFAIDMAMSADRARTLLSALQEALDQLPKTSQEKPH